MPTSTAPRSKRCPCFYVDACISPPISLAAGIEHPGADVSRTDATGRHSTAVDDHRRDKLGKEEPVVALHGQPQRDRKRDLVEGLPEVGPHHRLAVFLVAEKFEI